MIEAPSLTMDTLRSKITNTIVNTTIQEHSPLRDIEVPPLLPKRKNGASANKNSNNHTSTRGGGKHPGGRKDSASSNKATASTNTNTATATAATNNGEKRSVSSSHRTSKTGGKRSKTPLSPSAKPTKSILKKVSSYNAGQGDVISSSSTTGTTPPSSLSSLSTNTTTNSNTKPSTSKKKLTFHHKVEKKRHHRLQDLSEEERENVWYTEGDTKIILAIAKVTVKMMMKGEPCDDMDYCSRGLEGKTPDGSKKRQKNKLRVRKALLEEQEIQREEGVYDPEYLAQVCRKYSREVVTAAHSQALRDERDIQEYLCTPSPGHEDDSSPIQPLRKLRS